MVFMIIGKEPISTNKGTNQQLRRTLFGIIKHPMTPKQPPSSGVKDPVRRPRIPWTAAQKLMLDKYKKTRKQNIARIHLIVKIHVINILWFIDSLTNDKQVGMAD